MITLGCGSRDQHLVAGSAGRDLGGTLVVVVPADVATLMPPYALATQEQMAVSTMFDRLAEPGDSLNTIGDRGFVPRLADRWEWTHDSLAIVFHLDPRARWHDGVPVRSNDVVFTYRLYVNPAAGIENASQLTAIDSVTAPDSLTGVFWFKHRYPEQFFDATYQMWICPEHLLRSIPLGDLRTSDFAHHPVGDGRFRFNGSPAPATIEFVADTLNYRGRARLDRVVVSATPSPGAALTRLLAGEADFYQTVPPANVADLAQHPEITALVHDDASYGFLWFNLHAGTASKPHPIFGDRAVRQAFALALDRERIVRNVFDTLATVVDGPFALGTSSADPQARALPYDTARANHLLDSAGWRIGADGIRHKAGKPLAFSLIVPTSSKTRQQIALLIQDQLGKVGAKVSVDPIEIRALVGRLRGHDFDAALNVWRTDGAMSDIKQTWTTSAEKNGVNWASYESPTFDAIVDSALTMNDPAEVRALLHRAYAVINADVPAVWLYQPREVTAVHRRVHTAPLRPDAWYANLADWYVPAASRLPRDNIGLAAAPR
jgi:peptide/nickel transport system substrate-binding protein